MHGSESILSRLFRRHGKNVSRCPALFIVLPLVAMGVFAAGISRLVIDSDPDTIWVPPTSNTSLQQKYFNAAYDPFFRINQVNIVLDDDWDPSAANASIGQRTYYNAATEADRIAAGALTQEYMMAALALQLAIVNAEATDSNGQRWKLSDLCYKPIQGEGCLIETPLDWFFSDPQALNGSSAAVIQTAVANGNVPSVQALHRGTYTPGWSTIHTPMMASVILGGTDCLHANVTGLELSVCGGCGTYAKALVITFLLQATDALTPAAQAWEEQVFLQLAANFSYPGLRASYMAQRSLQDQINELGSQNKMVIVASYCVMFAYITLALGKFPHPVFTRALLGLQGIVIVVISCVGAIGICAWCGLHITMIVTEVVPFLILALGVDNVFIITKAFDRQWWGPYRGRWDPIVGSEGLKRWHARHTPQPEGTDVSTMVALASEGLDEDEENLNNNGNNDDLASVLTSSSAAPFLRAKPRASINQGRPGLGLNGEDNDSDENGDGGHGSSSLEPCYRGVYGHEGALSSALAEVGPTITSAAVCEMLAFGVGAATNIPALKQFCIVAAVAVALDYALQMTWFAAAIAMDARRQEGYRYDCVPCCRGTRPKAADAALAAAAPVSSAFLVDEEKEPKQHQHLHLQQLPSSSSDSGVAAATGPDASINGSTLRRQLHKGQYVRRFCRDYYSKLILSTPIRLLILLGWAGMLGVSLYGATQLNLGLPQQLALPQGSYLGQYFNDQSQYGEAGPPLYVVLQNVNYSHPDTPAAVEGMVESMSSISRWIDPPVTSWFRQFTYWQSNASRALIYANSSSSGVTDCPLPLAPWSTPIASQIAQFLWDVPIMSGCCQKAGYCSGQYGSDVKFLWGVPKPSTLKTLRESWADTHQRQAAGVKSAIETLAPALDETSSDADVLTEVLITAAGVGEEANFKPSATHLGELYAASKGDQVVYKRQIERLALNQQKQQLKVDAPPATMTFAERLKTAPQHLVSPVRFGASTRSNDVGTTATTDPVFVNPSSGAVIDDGGCDLSFGYIPHHELAQAMGTTGGAVELSSAVDASYDVIAALPKERRDQLLNAATSSSYSSSASAFTDDGDNHGGNQPAVTLIPCHVLTSRLRTQLTALHNQADFVGSLTHVKAAVERLQEYYPLPQVDLSVFGLTAADVSADTAGSQSGVFVLAYNFTSDNEHTLWLQDAPGGSAFPYSLTFVYYEQYVYIRGVALNNVLLTVGVVVLAGYIVTSSLAVAIVTALMVLCVTIDVVGFVWLLNPGGGVFGGNPSSASSSDPYGLGPYGVDINAVSVVNLVATVGLAVEFGVHIVSYFSYATGTRGQRVRAALTEMGSSVFTGITLTKLVGVSVLAMAPSRLFRLYYFRMYAAIILFGFFHGLMVLPAILSFVGWASFTPTHAGSSGKQGKGTGKSDHDQQHRSASVNGSGSFAEHFGARKASSASASAGFASLPAVSTAFSSGAAGPAGGSGGSVGQYGVTPTASASAGSIGSGVRFLVAGGSGSSSNGGAGTPSAYAST